MTDFILLQPYARKAGRIDPERWTRYFLGDPRNRRRWTAFYAD